MIRKLLIVVLLIGYFSWPYVTASKFSQAVIDRDTETIKQMVDAEALRESFMELAIEAAVQKASTMPGANRMSPEAIKEKMRSAMQSGPIKRQMEKMMSADTIARMMATGSKEDSAYRNPSWRSPVTFTIQDPEGESRAVFKFRGTGWKLSAIEVPQAELNRFLAMSGLQ